MMYFHRLRPTRASSIALRIPGVRYCQRTSPAPEAGTRSFSSSAPDFCTTIESSSSRLPNKNQCFFFLTGGAGDSLWIADVDLVATSGWGGGVGLGTSLACVEEGRVVGLGGVNFGEIASGEADWKGCLKG